MCCAVPKPQGSAPAAFTRRQLRIVQPNFSPSPTQPPTVEFLHRWTRKSRAGYRKLMFCGEQASRDGLQYFWSDTCCIDKSSSQELSEAINSMFRWYQNAKECYAYLSDVSTTKRKADYETFCFTWQPAFRDSRWFTRGWTLQELLAPRTVKFFSKEGQQLGDKVSLERQIHEITDIAIPVLRGAPLDEFSVEERFKWANNRQTTREEDKAYSLLGIFGVYMLPNYSEGKEYAFRRLRKEIRESSGNKVLSLNEEQKRTLLESLRFDQIDARQMSIKNAHVKTCRWLLHKPEYLDWLNPTKLCEHHGFLWIKGKPGTGKSTLMKFALAQARKTMKDTTVVSFFFNARGEDMEKSTIGTYRSLLLQLLERLPAFQSVFDSLSLSILSISTDYKWSVESLKMLLEQAVRSLGNSSVIRDMVQFFKNVGELAVSNNIHFQVCFSSRHYPHITIERGLDLILEGQDGHSQDITNYLESELKIGKSKLAQQIRIDLQEKASGIFMWVVLVVGILNKEHDGGRIHALRRRLQEIPRDLHELFRDILTRDSHNKDELALCIQWVLFAKQPLSPEQLYFAILSGAEPDALTMSDSDKITTDVIRRFILESSKGLTEITTSKLQKVQFIHESVRDFLLKEDSLGNIWSDLGSNLPGQSHQRLKQCCLAYMDMDIFTALKIPEHLPKGSPQEVAEFRASATDAFPFMEYAVQNVLYHADMAEGREISQKAFMMDFPLTRWISLDNLFEKHEVRRHTKYASLLYVLAEHNTPNLIRIHPSAHLCFEVKKERYGPPLFAAMATGSNDAVRALIEALFRNQPTETCPHEIYEQCCESTSGIVGRDFKFPRKTDMVSYLAEHGNGTILALVIRTDTNRIDVDLTDERGRTPLSWAAYAGRKAVAKLFLDTNRVNVDLKDEKGWTPLFLAAYGGYEAVVKLFLDTNRVDVDLKDKDGRTPLLWAAHGGHEAAVKLLLDTNRVDVDLKDKDRRTPLSWAAHRGHKAVVKLLGQGWNDAAMVGSVGRK
ncbi:hypothetical protein P153DRAFT_425248 [Dothidotthia symphoricarpi CBS 119687]|uniref:Uncharacterized protein n=1 Tax=Dothidotthia symphoricarpi CBS 119687 TaxID=1392245 RepID=A0A6A6A222_9PLEO|nr:uncharacterized protein P153DRAFT_425248 [Dothidotthia symphoricarpi CBS 119687]KAF2126032.1 hypothetical protein P153DRAFT_425248 [Dothidotthia symphoricarpi CBS 119687]